jgi:hypothetical protein
VKVIPPRLIRLVIWIATAGFIFLLFYPLVMEALLRLTTRGDSGLP